MATSKSLLISILVLRVLVLILLGGSIVVLATDTVTLSDGSKTSFKDLITYRYVIASAILGFLYNLFQTPFVIYHLSTGKRLIRNGCLPEFDFYGDKVSAFLVATAVGAGFAVTYEIKKFFRGVFDGTVADDVSETNKFLNRVYISSGILLIGLLFMAVLSVLSSVTRTSTSKSLFGS